MYQPVEHEDLPTRYIMLRRESFSLDKIETNTPTHVADLLIPPMALEDGVFHQMVENFNNSHHKDVIIKVIQNLLITYDHFYFEAHFGIIWTAFEIWINGLSDENTKKTMIDEKFGGFKENLKKYIKGQKFEFLDAETRADVYAKLAELQRRPFKSKLQKLLIEYEIDIKQLWPSSVEDIDKELKKLIDRRNMYIHEGKMDDFFQIDQDLSRLRYLISIWILKLLDFALDKLSPHEHDLWYSQRLEHEILRP